MQQARHSRTEDLAELASRQKERIVHFKDQARETLAPVLERSREYGRRIAARAKENPRPFVIGAIAVLGAMILLRVARRREIEERRDIGAY